MSTFALWLTGEAVTSVGAGDSLSASSRVSSATAEFCVQGSEIETPARVRAAAIFSCWVMSALRVGPISEERRMTSCLVGADSVASCWVEDGAIGGFPFGADF